MIIFKNTEELLKSLEFDESRRGSQAQFVYIAVDLANTSGVAVQTERGVFISEMKRLEFLNFANRLEWGHHYFWCFEKNAVPYVPNKDTIRLKNGKTTQDTFWAEQNEILNDFYKIWNLKKHWGFIMDIQASSWQSICRNDGVVPVVAYEVFPNTHNEVDAFLMLTYFKEMWDKRFESYIWTKHKYHPEVFKNPEKRIATQKSMMLQACDKMENLKPMLDIVRKNEVN